MMSKTIRRCTTVDVLSTEAAREPPGLRCDLPAPGESGLLRIRAKGEQAPVTVLHDELP